MAMPSFPYQIFAGASLPSILGHSSRFIRFGIVGASGVVVNMGVLFLLVYLGSWNHIGAAAVSTEAAILSNFVLNDRWTFRSDGASSGWLRRAGSYNAVALAGLAVSLAVLAILTDGLRMHYLTANLFAIGAATLWNYTGSSRFAWRRQPAIPLPLRTEPSW